MKKKFKFEIGDLILWTHPKDVSVILRRRTAAGISKRRQYELMFCDKSTGWFDASSLEIYKRIPKTALVFYKFKYGWKT